MDYRKLAMDELKSIKELQAADSICRDRLAQLNEELHSMKIPSPQTDPVQGGGNKTEDRWLSIISSQMDEERRLRNVRRRLKRFNTAWAVLAERDKAILTIWYIDQCLDCVELIMSRERCSRATAFRWRDDALIGFTRAFYGEVVV